MFRRNTIIIIIIIIIIYDISTSWVRCDDDDDDDDDDPVELFQTRGHNPRREADLKNDDDWWRLVLLYPTGQLNIPVFSLRLIAGEINYTLVMFQSLISGRMPYGKVSS